MSRGRPPKDIPSVRLKLTLTLHPDEPREAQLLNWLDSVRRSDNSLAQAVVIRLLDGHNDEEATTAEDEITAALVDDLEGLLM